MRRLRSSLLLLVLGLTTTPSGAESKPNFSGIWKLLNGDPQTIIIDQNETALRVFQFIGDRLVMVRGPIDGRLYSQTVDGQPCDFLARWEGDTLLFETRCDTRDSPSQVVHIQRLMRLASDGKTMTAERNRLVPQSETFNEHWRKQDPLAREDFITPFDARIKLAAGSANLSDTDGNLLCGWMAHAFNDVPQAERELLPIVKQEPPSKFRDEARGYLTEIYARNGLVRKAVLFCKPAERAFYKKLTTYPEMSVAHRGYARVQATHDSDGRIRLPVIAADKEASYEADTGANMSSLSMSEAGRLGLKLERGPRMHIMNGIVKFDAQLTIVPVLKIGAICLENVPFWVEPDARQDWPGTLGIDVLLKLETLRWNPSGDVEIGFPAQEKNIHKANLSFWDHDLMIDASSDAARGMIFFLDTGTNRTEFYPRFAIDNLNLVSDNGTKSIEQWDGLGGHREFNELTISGITLIVGDAHVTKRPSHVLLEKPPLHSKIHGVIGMDVLNAVPRVTLDLQAMRLTLEPAPADPPSRDAAYNVVRH